MARKVSHAVLHCCCFIVPSVVFLHFYHKIRLADTQYFSAGRKPNSPPFRTTMSLNSKSNYNPCEATKAWLLDAAKLGTTTPPVFRHYKHPDTGCLNTLFLTNLFRNMHHIRVCLFRFMWHIYGFCCCILRKFLIFSSVLFLVFLAFSWLSKNFRFLPFSVSQFVHIKKRKKKLKFFFSLFFI